VSSYHDGRRVEYAVVHDLTENGYVCTRAASSKGAADVIGIKRGQLLLVNVKRTTMPPPAERTALYELSLAVDGTVPLVALRPLRQPLQYRRLTGTGPKDWQPWAPDDLAP
jgi:Holliday junction resolvase